MRSASAAFGICMVLGQGATAETLSEVSSWRDVSAFLQKHEVSESAAILYIAAGCAGLPTISQQACLEEALTNPKSYEGISKEWITRVEARLEEERRRVETEEQQAESQKQQLEQQLREQRVEQEREAEIQFLEQTIRDHERTKREIEMTAGRLGNNNMTESDRDQLEEVLRRYEEDLANMRKRLYQIRLDEGGN